MPFPKSKFKGYFLNNYKYIFYFLSFTVPFLIFIRTMNPCSFGWDTTWFHIQVPLLYVGQPTGFPLAFLLGKLFSFLPIGTMAYRLNMFSVFWAALTVLVLFIVIKKLISKEYYIALTSSIFFVLFRVYWSQTSRFEMYTLHTFLIVLILLIGFYWANNKNDKFLYLYYFLIGLSFTNHPIALFLSPAFILFPIYSDWKAVFRVKKIFVIIFAIVIPNLLYLYIPIRSIQGYGKVDTFSKFIAFVSGSEWRNEFGLKSWNDTKEVFEGYLAFLKGDLTILVAVVILIGLAYLIVKRRKIFILIISLIILNFVPILMYVKPNDFYLISVIIFLSVPFACGLYSIKEGIVLFYNKLVRDRISKRIKFINSANNSKNDFKKLVIKSLFLSIFFISITFFPIQVFTSNFHSMDQSNNTSLYNFWKDIISEIEDNSILVSSSRSSHVAIYLSMYEIKKDVEILRGVGVDKLRDIVKENFGKKDIYYDISYLPDLGQYYEVKKVGRSYYWKDFEENLEVYRIEKIIGDVEIVPEDNIVELDYGKKATITYYLKNSNINHDININSMELRLPDIVKFVDIDPKGDMRVLPGMAQGAYMWTKGPYTIKSGDQFVLSFVIQANIKAEDIIDFRVTVGNMYVSGPEIRVIVK